MESYYYTYSVEMIGRVKLCCWWFAWICISCVEDNIVLLAVYVLQHVTDEY